MRRTGASLFLGLAVVVMLLAGCGQTTSSAGAPGGSTSATQAPSVDVKSATATVGGKSETILTNAKGMTLYYFMGDTARLVTCSGACAQTWPPLLTTAITPKSAPTLPGVLAALDGANGKQVIYNGH